MVFLAILLRLVLLCSAVYAASTAAPRDATFATSSCATWSVLDARPYELQSNLWGAERATSGNQCTYFNAVVGQSISWYTTWSWTGGWDVKSFSNIKVTSDKQLNTISSIPSTWEWSQSSSGSFVADVAYDLFTSSTPTGKYEHEIMVWMANFNYGPISYKYSICGDAVAIATQVEIENRTWNLYQGNNGENIVWSFLPSDGAIITSFNGDINSFLKYLTSQGYVPSFQYLSAAQGGTEAVSGAATFTTFTYSLEIN